MPTPTHVATDYTEVLGPKKALCQMLCPFRSKEWTIRGLIYDLNVLIPFQTFVGLQPLDGSGSCKTDFEMVSFSHVSPNVDDSVILFLVGKRSVHAAKY